MRKLLAMLLCVALLALGMCTALADGASLSVTGSGVVQVKSDLAIISIGVREAATDVLGAQPAVNNKIAAVRQALLDAGAEESELNTDSISIYANYDYTDGTEVIVGYTAYNSLSVRTPNIDGVGALIDAAFAAGANTLDGVQFTLQDDTQARDQAMVLAVEDARRKAEVLAEAAGMQISSIESISEGGSYTYDSMRNAVYAAAQDEAGGGAGTMVQAALVNVEASVTMEYELQ